MEEKALKTQKHYWTEKEDAEIQKHYPTATRKQLLRIFPHSTYNKIKARARKLGVKRPRTRFIPWQPQEDQILIKNYETSPWAQILILLPSRTKEGIWSRAQKLGLSRPMGGVRTSTNIFKTITPTSAWILGLFATDGCMCQTKSGNGNGFMIYFSSDHDVILKIQKMFNSRHKIRKDQKTKATYCLAMGNKETYHTLLDLGFTPRKTPTLRYPKIPTTKNTFRHFLRGAFEGDGCLMRPRAKKQYLPRLESSISSGSKKFLEDLMFLLNKYGINNMKIREIITDNNPKYELRFNMEQTIQLFELMYQDVPSDIIMNRKLAKYNNTVRERNKMMKNRRKIHNTHNSFEIRAT